MTEEKKISLTAPERETILLFSDSEGTCEVYTCSRPVMTKLDKLCKSNPESYKLVKKDSVSRTYTMDKRLISFRTPKVISDIQKSSLAINLVKARTKINK